MKNFNFKLITVFLLSLVFLNNSSLYAFGFQLHKPKSTYKNFFDKKKLEVAVKKICENKYLILSGVSGIVLSWLVFVLVKKLQAGTPGGQNLPNELLRGADIDPSVASEAQKKDESDKKEVNKIVGEIIEKVGEKTENLEKDLKNIKSKYKINHVRRTSSCILGTDHFDFNKKEDITQFANVWSEFTSEEKAKYLKEIPEEVKKELNLVAHKEKVSKLIDKILNKQNIENKEWIEAQESAKMYDISRGDETDKTFNQAKFLKNFIEKNRLDIYKVLINVVKKDKNLVEKKDFEFDNGSENDFKNAEKLFKDMICKVWKS